MSKYVEIASTLRERIINGEYIAESFLPYHKELSKEFKVSRMTIQNAIHILISEGLVITKRGLGTMVLKRSFIEESISRVANWNNITLSSINDTNSSKFEVLSFDVQFPILEIQNLLDINEEEPVYEILRLEDSSKLDSKLQRVIIPVKYTSNLTKTIMSDSLMRYLIDEMCYKIHCVKNTFTAIRADEKDQKYLNCSSSDPILKIDQVSYCEDGTPLFILSSHIACESSGYNYFQLL